MERPAASAANGLSSMVESQQQAVGPWGDEVALETVCFGCCSPNRPAPFDGRRNVAVSRGSLDPLPFHIFEDVNSPVKEVVADFAASVCREPSPTVLTSTPPRRRPRAPPAIPVPIRRSERLAKKSHHRATKPALQAQNVMMKRLGVTSAAHPPDAASYQQYVDMFSATLSTSQCECVML